MARTVCISGLIALTLSIGVSLGASPAHAQTSADDLRRLAGLSRLSLNLFGSELEGSARLIPSGFNGALRLPAQTRSSFAQSFTIPDAYAGGGLLIELVYETNSSGCGFDLRPNFLIASAPGESVNRDNASGGLELVGGVTAPAPGVFGIARFVIRDAPGTFRALRPGDGISFGIARLTDAPGDTCDSSMNIASMTVRYESR